MADQGQQAQSYFHTFKLSPEEETQYLHALQSVLTNLNKGSLYDPLEYCLKEMLENAKKANLKRVYFFEKKLNIQDSSQYSKGMEDFRSTMGEKMSEFEDFLEKMNLQVQTVIAVRENALRVDVANNSMILPEEYKRIEDRIRKAESVRNLAEAFMQFSDASESAGLGIVTIMLMLRKLGVSSEGFRIFRIEDKGVTLSRLKIPLDTVTESQTTELAGKITEEIRTIPKFPDNILELEKLLSDPDIAFSEVAKVVMRDPAITADLLKMVNSVQFMLPNKVGNINQAIALIGKKGLRDLLFSYGAQKIMDKKFKQMSEIWNHSFKCAFYAYNLARNQRLTGIMDDIYVAGILHDLGKIVIKYFSPELLKNITSFCASKGISSNFMESWSLGISHAMIGGMIARKWGLPDPIVAAVEFHHQPMLAPDKFRDTVAAIYMADFFISVEDGRKTWRNFEPEAVKCLKITGNEGMKSLWQRLKQLYKEQEERFK